MRISLVRLRWRGPSWSRGSLSILATALLGAAAVMPAPAWRRPADGPAYSTASPGDRFNRLGRAYLPELGKVYAAAWYEGARVLDEGRTVEDALAAVARSWEAGRIDLFDRRVTREFAAIVPQGASHRPRLELEDDADRR